MRVIVVTMVFNERVNLPIWVRHYRAQCPEAKLLVVDHGSTDGSTEQLAGVDRLRLPRTPFDDQVNARFMANLQKALLRFYDIFIHTDCDEMLLADPRRYASLQAYLGSLQSDVVAPTGLHLFHIPELEPPLDLERPILGQRRFVQFGAGMCKPMITTVAVRWHPGFHSCDRMPDYRTDLYQFHLATMDVGISLARLRLTREMSWSENALRRRYGQHQRFSDAKHMMRSYRRPAAIIKQQGLAAFSFESDLERLKAGIRLEDGLYRLTYFRGTVAAVPEAFFGLI